MSTKTAVKTVGGQLDEAKLGEFDRALAQMKLGTMLTLKKAALTQGAAATLALSPPALMIQAVRVTAGAAAAGARFVADTGGTPSATVCTISDDGATLTFEGTVTAVTVVYLPRSAVAMTTAAAGS